MPAADKKPPMAQMAQMDALDVRAPDGAAFQGTTYAPVGYAREVSTPDNGQPDPDN